MRFGSKKPEEMMVCRDGSPQIQDILDTGVTPPDPLSLPPFECQGSALLVPFLPWLRDALWRTARASLVLFYKQFFSEKNGPWETFEPAEQEFILDQTFEVLVYHAEIEPLLNWAAPLWHLSFP
jgi:hypothetical protein